MNTRIGSDICDIRRIEAAIARHGTRFPGACVYGTERAKAMRRMEKIQGWDVRQALCRQRKPLR